MLFETPDLIRKGDRYVQSRITPAVNFVNNFIKINERMPTHREFYTWVREYYNDFSGNLNAEHDSLVGEMETLTYTTNYRAYVSEKYISKTKIDWSKAFAICNLRDGEDDCYCSWTNEYDTSNWSWVGGFVNLLYSAVFGSIPLLLWWLNLRSDRKAGHDPDFTPERGAE